MDVSWRNVDVMVPNKGKSVSGKHAHLIKDCSGEARKGKVLAIMGPSGSGKTTLLKALVGRIPPGSKTKGVILADGEERELCEWIRKSGYVDQDDDGVFETLTVYDTIMYAAKFRSSNQNNIETQVENILKDLKIENIAYNKMDSISGGERKRTMIAIELVADPDLIFLDEPTSGLDTYITVSFVKLLKEYADKSGKTIVLTIHKPPQEAFQCFDDLLLLAKGKTIYCGEADKCEDFFQKHEFRRRDNSPFSDYVLEVLVKENVESGQLHEMIKINTSKFDDDKSKGSYIEKTSNDDIFDFGFNLQHIFLLLKRRFSIYNLNKSKIGGYLYNIIFAVLCCYLIRYMSNLGYITDYKSMSIVNVITRNEGFLLMLYTYMLMNCRVCISSIRPEYVIVKRELGVRTYSILSYCFSIYLYEFIQLLPFTLLFSISCYIVYIEFLSFFHIFISVLTLAAFIPAFVLLGSFSKNEKIINYILIIPIILIYVDIGAKTLSMYDNYPHLLRIKRCLLIVNGIWLPTLVMFVFKYITTWFLMSRNIKDEHDRAFYNNVIMKQRLTFLYNNQPPFSMPVSLLFCFTMAMILLYVSANVVMAGILFRSGIRMKLSKKK